MQLERSEDAVLLDDALSAFVSVRPRLFGIAYRILASRAEAEDIVQDVWLRWQTTDRSVILDARAFLATITTRLAINLAQSARSRHETYTGTWLPEPADTSDGPHLRAERGEALELAVLLLLEKLSPTERAAYVLREALDYSHQGIANVLKLNEANIRQLVSRARKHIRNGRQAIVTAGERRRFLAAFIEAAQKGNTAALEKLFATDVASYADGGGVVRATRMLVCSRKRVAKFIAAIASHFWTGMTFA
jgi:RNA polymerase sigma factor (sigma-70 family)